MSCTSPKLQEALLTAETGERLLPETALALLTEAPMEALLQSADRRRAQLHPDGRVSYVVDRNVNYSNICTCVCAFCAFYRKPGHAEGYTLSYEQISQKVAETLALGGSGILMQGGLHPELPLTWYTGLFTTLKERFPGIYLHCLSPTEIYGLMKLTGLPAREVLVPLKEAGLDSIPGGGGEILVDAIRQKRRSSCTAEEWLEITAEAHRIGLPTTATMMIGLGETHQMRIEHLERLRDLQDATGGFISFIPWTFQPDHTPLGKLIPERVGADEYLRLLALSRLYLDNILNLQVSWLTVGMDAGRQGLHAGANDLGSTMIEENVISAAGAHHQATEPMLRKVITEEGFHPALRNARYQRLPDRPVPPCPPGGG
ncbi:MAG: cyclic dehypoxanthinyl futalosine synthase [Planctomycetota bacterium]